MINKPFVNCLLLINYTIRNILNVKEGDGQTFTLSSHTTMNYKVTNGPDLVVTHANDISLGATSCMTIAGPEHGQQLLPDLASGLGPPLDCSS